MQILVVKESMIQKQELVSGWDGFKVYETKTSTDYDLKQYEVSPTICSCRCPKGLKGDKIMDIAIV